MSFYASLLTMRTLFLLSPKFEEKSKSFGKPGISEKSAYGGLLSSAFYYLDTVLILYFCQISIYICKLRNILIHKMYHLTHGLYNNKHGY